MNILFTCAGRRNYLIQYFRDALNGKGKIIAVDADPLAPALQDADLKFTVPGVYESEYVRELLKLCSEQEVDLVISLNDLELPVLANHREEFERLSVSLLISEQRVIDVCADKLATSKFLVDNGFDTPVTYADLGQVKLDLQAGILNFPLMVKPRWGSASIGLAPVYSLDELERAFETTRLTVARSALDALSNADQDGSVIIQEYIKGDEFGLDVLNNFDGKFECVFAKQKLGMRAGETDRAILSEDSRLHDIGARLGRSLAHTGNLDTDVFFAGERVLVLELNPRFGGGYPFSHELGARYPTALLSWAAGIDYDCGQQSRRSETVVAKCDRLIQIQAAMSS